MLVKTFGSAVYGVEAITIAVEVNINNQGKSEAVIVGLPDSAVKESLLRVESAIKDNGFFMPRTRLIVNLAPADIRKSGTAFDFQQAKYLRRYAEEVIIMFDADKSGIEKQMALVDIFLKADFKTQVCKLPDGMDPHDYISSLIKQAS